MGATSFEQVRGLAAAMVAVMTDLKSLPKAGFNQAQNYSYVRASDVTDTIRPLLAKHGLALGVQCTAVEADVNPSSDGRRTVTTVRAKFRYTLMHTSGETMESHWYGEAADMADKAFFKASTMALKYWLMATFCVSGDDADGDADSPEPPARQTEQRPAQPKTPPRADAPREPEPAQKPTSGYAAVMKARAAGPAAAPAGGADDDPQDAPHARQAKAMAEFAAAVEGHTPELLEEFLGGQPADRLQSWRNVGVYKSQDVLILYGGFIKEKGGVK